MPHLHDMHCHVDLYADYQGLIEECEQEGIHTLAVTNTPSVFHACVELTRGRRYVRPALGQHPELVAQRHHELALISDLLHETQYIGEVGLDFVTTDPENRRLQQQVFSAILEAAAAFGDRVVTVHSRRAAKEVVETIGPNFPGTIILHWYSGPFSLLAQAVRYGFYFSVNPAMFTSMAGRKIVQQMPRDRVLLETDGPFVSISGRPARPRDVGIVVSDLAKFWRVDVGTVHEELKQNLTSALKGGKRLTSHSSPDG